ncbi:MAG: CHASE3 domain-containing protein [Steroidobacteraceae bacterium]
MKKVLRSGIDRRYVLLPLLLGVALVVSMHFLIEARREVTRNLTSELREREDRMRQIDELIYTSVAAESAQRGFVLTGDAAYLTPYASGRVNTAALLAQLISWYELRDPSEVTVLQSVKNTLATNYGEMDRTIDMVRNGNRAEALRLMSTDVGLHAMAQIRRELDGLRSRENQHISDGVAQWNSQVAAIRFANVASTVLTLVLLIAIGLLISHEIKRRDQATKELEIEVSLRTAELRELSEHMLQIAEVEKSALARELHDELGGLLVAMRMDFSQLRRKLQMPDAAAEERWARIDAGLKAGVELKRRVIEELRPTLLDNMGLVVALRWQAEQSCLQGNLKLTTDLPEAEPELNHEAAIAVFRTVQEALSNVLKHARASHVRLEMVVDGDHATITVEDNGIGLPDNAGSRTGAHGLKQMKFRMQAIRGSCDVRNAPNRGTITTIKFAITPNTRPQVGAWDPS